MAISAIITTVFGEERDCYIRLNNVEVSNHGVPANALFRGFLSQQAFESGSHFVWEKSIEFTANVSQPIWSQAYEALVESENFNPAEV